MTLATHPVGVRSGVDALQLRQSQFFSALGDDALGDMISLAHSRTIPGGILLSETADFANFIFVVERGRIHCYRLSQTGSPVTLCVLHRGELFMEPRVVTPDVPSSTSGIAARSKLNAHFQSVTETRLYCFPRNDVMRLIAADRRAADAWLELQDTWMSDLYGRLEDLSVLDVPQRLARTLTRLASASHDHLVQETHQELAWLVGASRETVTKELNRLRRLKLVGYEQHHSGIQVTDMERLSSL
jgi:CRP-like cAMP-binding protein